MLAYFGPKGLRKIAGLGPPKKICQNRPKWASRVLRAVFGSSGTLSDPIGALSGSEGVHFIVVGVPKPLRPQ